MEWNSRHVPASPGGFRRINAGKYYPVSNRDGSGRGFCPSTYGNFGTVASGTITLPTTRSYQFTNFNFRSGMTSGCIRLGTTRDLVQGNFASRQCGHQPERNGGGSTARRDGRRGGGIGGTGGSGVVAPTAGTAVDPAQQEEGVRRANGSTSADHRRRRRRGSQQALSRRPVKTERAFPSGGAGARRRATTTIPFPILGTGVLEEAEEALLRKSRWRRRWRGRGPQALCRRRFYRR